MTVAIPSGIVSFLFTDVEGSTRLWDADASGMAASLALHDDIMREACAAHGGHVFSTAGDAFAVAFATAADAVSAATDIQVGLRRADWPGPALVVRMGIHTGTAEERDGDYFGPVLNRAARIMSAGHGGQVLLSSVTAGLFGPGGDVTLHDLGTHHLKDLAEPEHVFELRHPDLPIVNRKIVTLDVRRHNLPDYLTTFVGRTDELGELTELVSAHRLVSLTGVGGTGKTRLAVEAARRWADDRPDGAWLVELAPVTNPQFVMTTIGDVWGLRPGEGATIEDVLTRYLWSRDLVVVIDNCEHLLDSSAAAIKMLLDACPTLRVVATSRESLGIPGEVQVRVPSLGLSDGVHPVEESDAVRLFLDRAKAVRPDFEPTPEELSDIGRICGRIDGIPLGLELAAARLRSMSTAELADRLEDSFRILAGSAKAALPRQRTLHATIDWSYDLLKPPERAMFRRLSLFTGSFDVRAAEAVCAGEEVEAWEVLDHIDSLVDKSLVIAPSHQAGGTRYRLLEPVRQYAQERLSETAEPVRFRLAHAHYYAGLVGDAGPGMRGPEQLECVQRVDRDYGNVRSALSTFLEAGDFDRHLALVFDLYQYWMLRGMQLEGIEAGLEGLDAAGEDATPLNRIRVWYTTARFGAEITSPAGIEHARKGLELARATGDPNTIGRMELALGTCIRHATTDPEYLEHLLEGRRLLEAHPEPHWWEPTWERGLQNLLFAAYLPADDDRVMEHLRAALAIFEEVGDRLLLAATLADSSGMYGEGDRELDEWALGNVRRACDILAGMEAPNWYGHALYYLGILLRREGEFEESRELLSLGAGKLEDVGDANCWAGANRYLARCEARLGDTGPARARLVEVIDRMPVLPMQEVVKPRTLDSVAEVMLLASDHVHAGVLLGAALAAELPAEYGRIRGPELEALRAELVGAVGEPEAERLIAEGRSLDVDEALRYSREWLAQGWFAQG